MQRQRLGQDLAHRHARIERGVGVLEDDLRIAAEGAQLIAHRARARSRPSKRTVPASGSISRSTSRLTVDLPQPDSPTSASVLPASTLKLTPSTALTKAVGRPNTERVGDEMLDQAFDLEQRGHDTSLSSGALMQREAWPGLTHRERRRRGDADVADERAARGETAAGRRIGHVRHHAFDGGEMRGAAVEPRDRAEQADGVGMLRIGEELVDRRALDDLAGIHHRDLVADLGDHAEIVGDQDDRGAACGLQFAHQIEDLRLQGDVERGGRLVGDQQPRDRRPAPSRSSRAGACRRKACADIRRCAFRARGCGRGAAVRWRARAPGAAIRRDGAGWSR